MADYDNPRPSSQPIGSTDQAVAKDNLISLDIMALSEEDDFTNRKGELRKTTKGLENLTLGIIDDFNEEAAIAIAAAGYDVLGDFADSIVAIDNPNEVLTSKSVVGFEGYVWKTNQPLPYTRVGSDPTIPPELGKWLAVAIGELQTIARSLNISDNDIIYSTDTVTPITAYIYSSSQQKTYRAPSQAVGETITSLTVATLICSAGTFELSEINPYLGSIVYVNAVGEGGIIDDTGAIQDAIDKASSLQYVKRGVKIVLRAPKNYYQVSAPLNFDELWNVHLECETKNGWNRSEFATAETRGGNVHWIGNSTDSLFDFGTFCFGVNFKNIIVNGRETCKLAFDLTAPPPAVLRDYYFDNCGAILCDFGTVNGDIVGTDLAPVTWINPIFTQNTSAAIINNSGNATMTVIGGFITGNGFAPTIGNSFIPDSDNDGYQILNRAGHLSTLNITLDGSPGNLAASGENILIAGGSATLDGWDDTPEVVSVNCGGNTENIVFGKWRHFDGSMTKGNTPTSIIHSAPCVMNTHGGMFVFGDIEINAGNQAGLVDSGVRFEDPLSGFTGTVSTSGGLSRNTRNGFGQVAATFGGDFIPIGTDVVPAFQSIYNRTNRPATANRSLDVNSFIVTETFKANGDYERLTNTWFDTGAGQYKSIVAGGCIRKLITTTQLEQLAVYTAVAANEVVTFSAVFGARKGVGSNGAHQLELSGNKFSFDKPNSGLVARGDTFMSASATPGGKAGEIVTTTGTVGSTAVLKPFGVIDA